MALLGEGQQLQSSLLVEVDKAFFLHLLENLDDVRVCAVDLFGQRGRVHFCFCVPELNEHHGGLLAEEDAENFFVFHATTPTGAVFVML